MREKLAIKVSANTVMVLELEGPSELPRIRQEDWDFIVTQPPVFRFGLIRGEGDISKFPLSEGNS